MAMPVMEGQQHVPHNSRAGAMKYHPGHAPKIAQLLVDRHGQGEQFLLKCQMPRARSRGSMAAAYSLSIAKFMANFFQHGGGGGGAQVTCCA